MNPATARNTFLAAMLGIGLAAAPSVVNAAPQYATSELRPATAPLPASGNAGTAPSGTSGRYWNGSR